MRAASRRSGIPLAEWVDLSTGINPHGWPVPRLPPEVWQRLPEEGDGLEVAAAAYYGSSRLLPVPGSQAAIAALPELVPPTQVACVAPLYREHPHAWSTRGHRCVEPSSIEEALEGGASVVVVCNPNNPTATRLPRVALLAVAAQLAQRNGWLIVDEAFADAEPEDSLVAVAGTTAAPNLVVLRSLGKFFGLAGARVGFVFASQPLLDRLAERVGPWAVSGPAREVAKLALLDAEWQRQTRLELEGASNRLQQRLARLGPARATRLFCALRLERAEALAEHLASRGILVRAFPGLPLLRFGLWATESEWSRLDAALSQWEAR